MFFGKILIVDDHKDARDTLSLLLKDWGYQTQTAESGFDAINLIQTTNEDYPIIFLDMNMPGLNGLEALKKFKELNPACEIIMHSGIKDIDAIVDSIKTGAFSYLGKDQSLERLRTTLQSAITTYLSKKDLYKAKEELIRIQQDMAAFGFITQDVNMKEILKTIPLLRKKSTNILIIGNTGVGKEVIARLIHGIDNLKPFIAINCGGLTEALVESEIFGHEKGSFTNAYDKKIGKFELANGGTLYLDEMDSLGMGIQDKLLRVIQEREITRVGGRETIKLDFNLICSSKDDLYRKVKEGTFREDLYYRINVVELRIPPLKERKDDIPLLAEHFLKSGNSKKYLTPKALKFLLNYDWPGNIRELENIISRMKLMTASNETITEDDIPNDIRRVALKNEGYSFHKDMEDYERSRLLEVLKYKLNLTETAKFLNLPINTLKSKMSKYDLRIIN